ncbi:hypothetical protein [Saccharomonospora azurea]|uniref:hypothetical protein n=1 Tax=Saccharomonospora azurea TaxID=40988 RepID=UPI0018DED697|nr:hypothetical protein [Saccharomonospora azurea]
MEIELFRTVCDDDPEDSYVSWHAEWSLQGSSSGTEDNDEDLTVLVDAILADVHPMADRYVLRLDRRWRPGAEWDGHRRYR